MRHVLQIVSALVLGVSAGLAAQTEISKDPFAEFKCTSEEIAERLKRSPDTDPQIVIEACNIAKYTRAIEEAKTTLVLSCFNITKAWSEITAKIQDPMMRKLVQDNNPFGKTFDRNDFIIEGLDFFWSEYSSKCE